MAHFNIFLLCINGLHIGNPVFILINDNLF